MCVFFFKQKTAYEMRISDWSADVCSSDLSVATPPAELDADLFVIGPEVPLVDGLADRLRAAGKLVLGPGADGAQLEGSKTWMKEVVSAAGVPTEIGRAACRERVCRYV